MRIVSGYYLLRLFKIPNFAQRFSQAPLNVIMKDKKITFFITDDGTGADIITPGFGLKSMRDRIEQFGGELEFESNNGFSVKGMINVKNVR